MCLRICLGIACEHAQWLLPAHTAPHPCKFCESPVLKTCVHVQVVTMKDGRPMATPHINVALSADNRVYNDAVASAFLEAFCANISSPVRMLS